MEFTIDIPDTLVGPIDTYLQQLFGDPVDDPATGQRVAKKLFPGGVDDWIPAVVAEKLQQLPVIAQLPEIRAKHAAIERTVREIADAVRPTVQRVKPIRP